MALRLRLPRLTKRNRRLLGWGALLGAGYWLLARPGGTVTVLAPRGGSNDSLNPTAQASIPAPVFGPTVQAQQLVSFHRFL